MLRMKCQELSRFARNPSPFGLRTGLLTYPEIIPPHNFTIKSVMIGIWGPYIEVYYAGDYSLYKTGCLIIPTHSPSKNSGSSTSCGAPKRNNRKPLCGCVLRREECRPCKLLIDLGM